MSDDWDEYERMNAPTGFSEAEWEAVIDRAMSSRDHRPGADDAERDMESVHNDMEGQRDHLAALDLAALASIPPLPKEFSISGLVPLAEVTLFTGAGSAGKSLLAQQVATAAAAGIDNLGFRIQPTNAIYVTCEDDADQLHWRQSHICKSLGVSMASLAGKLRLVSLRGDLGNELATYGSDGSLKPTPAYRRLRDTIISDGAKLVWLDNVAHLFTGNENDRGEVTRFVNLLNRLAGETGASIVLLGHPNKGGDEYSGSTAWPNAVRSRIYLEHEEETDVRILRASKANYARKGEACRFIWIDWAFVREDDLPDDLAKELAESIRAGDDNNAFLNCLRERTRQKQAVSEKPSATYAPLIFARMPESKKIGKSRLEKAMDRLFRTDRIERAELWRGPDRKPVFGLREVPNDAIARG